LEAIFEAVAGNQEDVLAKIGLPEIESHKKGNFMKVSEIAHDSAHVTIIAKVLSLFVEGSAPDTSSSWVEEPGYKFEDYVEMVVGDDEAKVTIRLIGDANRLARSIGKLALIGQNVVVLESHSELVTVEDVVSIRLLVDNLQVPFNSFSFWEPDVDISQPFGHRRVCRLWAIAENQEKRQLESKEKWQQR